MLADCVGRKCVCVITDIYSDWSTIFTVKTWCGNIVVKWLIVVIKVNILHSNRLNLPLIEPNE
jgi:hypothetical protein